MTKPIVGLFFLLLCPLQARAQKTVYVHCPEVLKEVVLSGAPTFGSPIAGRLKCGEEVSLLERKQGWAKLRSRDGKEGFTSEWFVSKQRLPTDPKAGNQSKDAGPTSGGTNNCGKKPLNGPEDFKRLHAIFQQYIEKESFPNKALEAVSLRDLEELAFGAYSLAFLTADKPGKSAKADVFKGINQNDKLAQTLQSLAPDDQIFLQLWIQRVLNVLSKAFDQGYIDARKACP